MAEEYLSILPAGGAGQGACGADFSPRRRWSHLDALSGKGRIGTDIKDFFSLRLPCTTFLCE